MRHTLRGASSRMILRSTTAVVQSLEIRRLLAAAPFARISSRGSLIVNGDAMDNVIAVRGSGTAIVAERDGVALSFDSGAVKRVILDGGAGNDLIRNNAARRASMIGGDGNDTLIGGGTNDTLTGGAGLDMADYRTRGTPFSFLIGQSVEGITDDLSFAVSGRETDTFSDVIEIVSGTNFADDFSSRYTGAGGNTLPVTLFGQGGNDTFREPANTAAIVAVGGPGKDFFWWGDANSQETMRGGGGNDTVKVQNDVPPFDLDGGPGIDTIDAGEAVPAPFVIDLRNYPGVEQVIASSPRHDPGTTGTVVIGSDGPDRILVSPRSGGVAIHGGGGNDTIIGSDGADTIFGDEGNDLIDGGGGNDQLHGGVGDDTITGGNGKDRLSGDAGDDTFFAHDGVIDRLYGGTGTNVAEVDNSAHAHDLVVDVATLLP